MMRNFRMIFPMGMSLSILLLAACTPKPIVKPVLADDSDAAGWMIKTLEEMTIAEKAGQMVTCRYSGAFVNRDSDNLQKLMALVTEHGVGGFCLFGGNLYETAFLTNTLQKAAKIPLLIASDLERGLGNQIDGGTLFPPAMSIGATDSEEVAYGMGKVTALEARAIGIHMTYAPVADVNNNPDNPIINVRSFGEDPERVSRLAVAFIKGCQENGLIATAKHFPGHGDVSQDSHILPLRVAADRERLDRVELYPFKESVRSGVGAIMVAHLLFPALDPTPRLPASLSHRILTEFLRKELGFEGLIVTDAMDMGGVTVLFEPEEAAIRAVKAGADMILLSPRPKEAIEALTQAVRRGDISEQRIDNSVRRILAIKAGLGLHRKKLVDPDLLGEKIATKAHLAQAASAFDSSMTLVKNENNILPIVEKKTKIAVLSLSSDPGDYFAGEPFVMEMKKRLLGVYEFYAETSTGQEYLDEAQKNACEADLIVIGLFSRVRGHKGSAGLDPKHARLINNLAARPTPVVVVSFGSPYFLRLFPGIDAYLCAYRNAAEAQSAAAKALFGEIDIRGRLAVSIPGLYSRGHGLGLTKVRLDNQ
ncbi:MAG: glycoside hydrolase family 3 C-terminal domain-containing protein [Candidatus Aminicenantes bacterium]|nr:glycoside hydrolase family 3 C-terminal domain-containing protein [Candidatus Aminicenantes bacterium]